MRSSLLPLLLVLVALISSCRKGRNLPEQTDLFVDISQATVPTQVGGSYFGGTDINEEVELYLDELKHYLSKNNIRSSSSAEWTLEISSIRFGENHEQNFYFDTCSSFNYFTHQYDTSWYDVSSIWYAIDGTVSKNGNIIGVIDADISRQEKVKEKYNDQGCRDKWSRGLWCGKGCLRKKMAKEVRKQVSRLIFRNENWDE